MFIANFHMQIVIQTIEDFCCCLVATSIEFVFLPEEQHLKRVCGLRAKCRVSSLLMASLLIASIKTVCPHFDWLI